MLSGYTAFMFVQEGGHMSTNMDTLFIADDEISIREGLRYIVDWEELGFSICGEASNGEDALAQILDVRPSLVMLDVKMPKLHGTEVIRLAREAGYQGRCIILSGYSDFKYAQEAIKSGVSSYLTKPIDEEELIRTVSQIKEELSREKQRSCHFAAFQHKAKNVILHELMTNTLSTPLTEEYIANFRLCADAYQIVLCEDFHTQAAAAPYTFAELLKVTNRDNNIFDHLEIDHKDIVLLKGTHGLNRLSDFLERFEDHPPQEGSPLGSMFLAYGRPVASLDDLHLSYQDASTLLSRRFFCAPEQHSIGYDMLPGFPTLTKESSSQGGLLLDESLFLDFAGRLTGYIQSYNRKMMVETLSELENTLLQVPSRISDIKLFLTDLYLKIRENVSRSFSTLELPFAANATVIEFISSRNYLYEIIQFLSEQFEKVMTATGNPSRDTILDDVLYYIDHNFRNNIKLETIAPLFGYNSAYLGKIFTKSAGESFNSYIDHKRIEYSKQLLMENKLKVYEIAEQSGYKNVDYFHKKFRKYVGESPAEFRKRQGFEPEGEKYPPPEKISGNL